MWHAWLFRATDFCWAAVDALETSHPYEVEAAIAFLDGAPDRSRAEAAADRLGRLVREQGLAVLDPARIADFPVSDGYAPGEHHFPHDYARVPESLARRWFTDEEMKRSLDHLQAAQQEDGGWPIRMARVGARHRPGGAAHGDHRGAADAARPRPRHRVRAAVGR